MKKLFILGLIVLGMGVYSCQKEVIRPNDSNHANCGFADDTGTYEEPSKILGNGGDDNGGSGSGTGTIVDPNADLEQNKKKKAGN